MVCTRATRHGKNATSQLKLTNRHVFPSKVTTVMGICNSVFTSDTKRKELNENNLVETQKKRNEMRLKHSANTPKVSTSVDIMDIESSDESVSSSTSTSTFSEAGSDVCLPQEELEALVICGKAWQLRQEAGEVCVRKVEGLKSRKKKFFLRSKKGRQLQMNKKSEINLASKGVRSVPSANVCRFRYSGPPPRPSPWKEVYLTMIKANEQMAEESLRKNEQVNQIKERLVNTKQISGSRKQLAKTINRQRFYAPEERVTESEPDNAGFLGDEQTSGSLNPASTRSSPTASRGAFIISDDGPEESFSSADCYYSGNNESPDNARVNGDIILRKLDSARKVSKRKSQRSIRQKRNKVSPQ